MTVGEGAGATTVTVTAAAERRFARTRATAVSVTVGSGTAVSGTDFATEVTGFTITIRANQASGTGTFRLSPIPDTVDEPDETV